MVLKPRIEVVIMTAYTDYSLEEIIQDMELLNKVLYLRKPFMPEEIQQTAISLVEKWNAESELAAKNRQLETVLDATGDAIAMFDVTGHLQFANRCYRELFGLTEQHLREKSAAELRQQMKHCFQEPSRFEEAEASFFANPQQVSEEMVEVRRPDYRMLYRTTAPVRDAEEKIIGRIIVYRDVSQVIEKLASIRMSPKNSK